MYAECALETASHTLQSPYLIYLHQLHTILLMLPKETKWEVLNRYFERYFHLIMQFLIVLPWKKKWDDGWTLLLRKWKQRSYVFMFSWNLRSVQDSAWLCPPIPVPRWKSVMFVVPNWFSSDMQCVTVGPFRLDNAQGSTKCWTFDSPTFPQLRLFLSMRLWGVLLIFYSLNAFGNKLSLSVGE